MGGVGRKPYLWERGQEMKDKRSLHLKVQELVDCYATTDPLKEMSVLDKDADKEEAALKWVALAALHGINSNAREITVNKAKGGKVNVVAKYYDTELPSPGTEVGGKIISAVRNIANLEGDKGNSPIALGIRDGSIELAVRVKRDEEGESLTLKFPG
jgi:hypothetical protein